MALRAQLEARTDLSASEQLLLNRLRETLDDKDTGNYELLVYSFAQRSRVDGVDVLRGRGGVDVLEVAVPMTITSLFKVERYRP